MRLHHLALRTADVPRLEEFYRGVLGLRVVRRTEASSVWLDAGGTLIMLERRADGEPSVPEGTLELVAFAITEGERAAWAAKLANAGIAIEARTDFTLYVRDPDGRRVGVSAYPLPAPSHAQAPT